LAQFSIVPKECADSHAPYVPTGIFDNQSFLDNLKNESVNVFIRGISICDFDDPSLPHLSEFADNVVAFQPIERHLKGSGARTKKKKIRDKKRLNNDWGSLTWQCKVEGQIYEFTALFVGSFHAATWTNENEENVSVGLKCIGENGASLFNFCVDYCLLKQLSADARFLFGNSQEHYGSLISVVDCILSYEGIKADEGNPCAAVALFPEDVLHKKIEIRFDGLGFKRPVKKKVNKEEFAHFGRVSKEAFRLCLQAANDNTEKLVRQKHVKFGVFVVIHFEKSTIVTTKRKPVSVDLVEEFIIRLAEDTASNFRGFVVEDLCENGLLDDQAVTQVIGTLIGKGLIKTGDSEWGPYRLTNREYIVVSRGYREQILEHLTRPLDRYSDEIFFSAPDNANETLDSSRTETQLKNDLAFAKKALEQLELKALELYIADDTSEQEEVAYSQEIKKHKEFVDNLQAEMLLYQCTDRPEDEVGGDQVETETPLKDMAIEEDSKIVRRRSAGKKDGETYKQVKTHMHKDNLDSFKQAVKKAGGNQSAFIEQAVIEKMESMGIKPAVK